MAQRSTGVVKWFNNKAGYGFLTLMVDGQTSEDIFVHHSEIQVGKDQYKYLVQGEYVEFVLSTDAGEHKCLATAVRGVNGGKLMCETRNETRSVHPPRERTHTTGTRGYRSNTTTSSRQTEDDQVEWLLVKRKRTMPHTASERGGRGRGRGSGSGRRPVAELS